MSIYKAFEMAQLFLWKNKKSFGCCFLVVVLAVEQGFTKLIKPTV